MEGYDDDGFDGINPSVIHLLVITDVTTTLTFPPHTFY